MSASRQKYIDLAQRLESLAQANESAPRDYYGEQFWSDEDIQLLRVAAAALRECVRGADQPTGDS